MSSRKMQIETNFLQDEDDFEYFGKIAEKYDDPTRDENGNTLHSTNTDGSKYANF